MADVLADRGKFWTPAPDWDVAEIARPDWSGRRVPGLGQTLVSGNIAAATTVLAGNAPEIGLWQVAGAGPCAVRLSRDRALLVTPVPLDAEAGWREEGWAATPCEDAYAVIELTGGDLTSIVAEATSVDLRAGSRSASVLLAGVPVLLYRSAPETMRIHVESGLATYLWTWLATRK